MQIQGIYAALATSQSGKCGEFLYPTFEREPDEGFSAASQNAVLAWLTTHPGKTCAACSARSFQPAAAPVLPR